MAHWEHFEHRADLGIRGVGATVDEAFAQAALALTAAITDPSKLEPREAVTFECTAPDLEILFVDFLNALVLRMATERLVFAHVDVQVSGTRLTAHARGEPVDVAKHQPAVEVKGATFTELFVGPRDGEVVAQCVVDV